MYMPGRLRTASSPSRTVMFSEPYSAGVDGRCGSGCVKSVVKSSVLGLDQRGPAKQKLRPSGESHSAVHERSTEPAQAHEAFPGSAGRRQGFALREQPLDI